MEAGEGKGEDRPLNYVQMLYGEASYPFAGNYRTIQSYDLQGGTMRHPRIAFPSRHLPRQGQSLPLNKFDRVQIFYFEGPLVMTEAQTEKLWQADQGILLIQTKTLRSMTLELQNARMQSESPSAKGIFELSGTITVALTLPGG